MYHVELRQFPHNFCRFNLSEDELRRTVLEAWARHETVELGERRWDPRQASLTVLDGPRLSMPDLAMGRGWLNARRRSIDVTAAMLAGAHPTGTETGGDSSGTAGACSPASASAASTSASAASTGSTPRGLEATALAGELLALLGDDPLPLLRAWQLALERHPDRTPSECLALAEELMRR